MNTTEKRITSKIIRELALFLMFHKINDFTITTRINEEKTELITKTKRLDDKTIAFIKARLEQGRKLEIETYGWELVGDLDSESELEIVGSLIDGLTIEHDETSTTLVLTRKNRYRR
ncbi:MAG: hypothetical protein ACLFUQ_04540 [Candidatus Izemoplasmataceae bacterium]